MQNFLLRPAVQADLEVLWHFLAITAYEPDSAAAKVTPVVALHLLGWKRACDFGVVAEQNDLPIGAASARQFSKNKELVFYVDDQTPEGSIGVVESHRDQGIGSSLVDALCAEANRRCVGLCLNVRDTNLAIQLYEKAGFVRVSGVNVKNRVGGFSFGMVRPESNHL